MTSTKTTIGVIALACGIAGLLFAMYNKTGGLDKVPRQPVPVPVPEPEEMTLKEKGVKFLKDKAKEKLLGKDSTAPPPPPPETDWKIVNPPAFWLGNTAAVLGLFTLFIRDRRRRDEDWHGLPILINFGMAGLTFGLIAVFWTYVLLAVLIGILLYIISSYLDGGLCIGLCDC